MASTPDYAKEVRLFKRSLLRRRRRSVATCETIADAFSAEASRTEKADITPGKTPSATQLAALAAAGKSFSAPKVEAATKNLEAWGESHCGVK